MNQQTILITGAASGIGAATAKLLAHHAKTLILHSGSNLAGLDALARELKQCRIEIIIGDLSIDKTFFEIEKQIQSIGKLDVLVSNAGYPNWSKFGELSPEEFQHSLDINVKAFHRIATIALPYIRTSNQGRIVAISSFLAHRYQLGETFVPASAASKAALEAMVKSLAMQLASEDIAVNAIVPGYIKKDGPNHKQPSEEVLTKLLQRIPMGRLGLPEEVAGLIEFLLSEKGRYITGQSIAVDGGLTV